LRPAEPSNLKSAELFGNVPPAAKAPLTYDPFSSDNAILDLMLGCYAGLSPENLCCDGDASAERYQVLLRPWLWWLTLASNNDHAEAYNNLGVLELKRGHVEAVSSLIVNYQYPALGASRPVLGLLYVLCLR